MGIRIAPELFVRNVREQRERGTVVVPNIVDGERIFDGELVLRDDPADPSRSVTGAHEASDDLVRRAVAASRRAQREWEKVPGVERARRVGGAVAYLRDHAHDWATRIAVETGKPLLAVQAEVDEIRGFLETYGAFGSDPATFVDELAAQPGEMRSETILRPYGVFGVITPFNYPAALAAGLSIGAVIAGNGLVIKTSHEGPWSGQAVYELFESMGLPRGLVNIVHGRDAPARALVASDVDGIGFTGSARVGHEIVSAFSSGPYARPVIAEMGGKNPVIVTDTADVGAAARGIAFSGYDLAGQKCSAASRILATPGVYEELLAAVESEVAALRFDDPTSLDAFAGPLTNERAVQRYDRLLAAAEEAGFRVFSGARPDRDGHFVAPVVISGVPEEHWIAREEHFLPVVTLSPMPSFDAALRAANDLPFGLTAGIFTGLREEADRFLLEIEAGCINVNAVGHATTGFLPGSETFGGWKASGSTGKQGYGKWYIPQFMREQTRKIPADPTGLR